MKYQYDVFVSHAETDRAWVQGYLLPALSLPPERVITPRDFRPGASIVQEFERAVTGSRYTLLILTKAYLTDTWSTFGEQLVSHASVTEQRDRLIPLLLQPCELPLHIDFRVQLDCTDQENWEGETARLRELLDQQETPLKLVPCPYPGMKPFSEKDSKRFFGREQEVWELLDCLRRNPFRTVIGPSGSGKSSLVFAGLIPALRKSSLFGSGQWDVRILRPGATPQEELNTVLGSPSDDPVQAVTQILDNVQSPSPNLPHQGGGISPTLVGGVRGGGHLLLVVDQFEELFTLAGNKAVPFQQTLLQLIRVQNCYLVLTVRADFYADLMAGPLWPKIKTHRTEVTPLSEDGLRQAIVGPAEDVGVFVETALVDQLVTHAADEPGILPLVQETLVLLWDRLERRFLSLKVYKDLVLSRSADSGPDRSGLQVAMARHADATLDDLESKKQNIARRIFLRLIQFGEGRADTRRQQPVNKLRSEGEDPSLFTQTLDHLTKNRLLTLSGEEEEIDQEEGEAGKKVDIAHEALINGWPTLQKWLTQRREAERTRRRLEAKAAEWVRLGREKGGLLDEAELPEAERWLKSPDAADLGCCHRPTDPHPERGLSCRLLTKWKVDPHNIQG